MKLNVLIVTHHFFPEFGGAATMELELAKHLAGAGHNVTVLTQMPHHHMISATASELKHDEVMDGIHVIRIDTPDHSRSSLGRRAIIEIWIDICLVIRSLRIKPVDIILIMSPPITLAYFFELFRKTQKNKLMMYVQDIFPEYLISMGIVTRGNILFRVAKLIEKMAYKGADYVGVHSPKNKNYVISCGIDESKVHLVPLWVDTDFIGTKPLVNHFAEANQLDHRFVVMYAGTVGFAMGAQTIPQTAKLLEQNKDIEFIVVGGGSKLTEMQREIERLALKNIKIVAPLPREDLPQVLAAGDILLVLMRKELSDNPNGYFLAAIPHKLLSNMASGKPILASAELESDTAELVRCADCGMVAPPEDPDALARMVLEMKNDPKNLKVWGKNGQRYAKVHFDSALQVQRMEELFITLANGTDYQFNDPWQT